MKFKIILGLLFLTISIGVNAQQTAQQSPTPKNDDSKSANTSITTYVRPDKKTRQKRYLKSLFSLTGFARTVASSGFNTALNKPEEWGGTWEGFGRRVGSGLGKNAIKQTTIYALDESFKLDSKFYRSQKRDFGSKMKNALISPFTARTPEGKRVIGFPRIVGTYTASIIAAEVWYPKRYTYLDGLKAGTFSLGMNAAFNVVKELFKK